MVNELQNNIMPVIIQSILAILGVLITTLAAVAIKYISKKRAYLIEKMGAQSYNNTYKIAKGIYFAVEQQFKDTAHKVDEKRETFDKLLLKKIPYLTQEELNLFREQIVGEINSAAEKSGISDPADSLGKGN